MGAGDLAEGTPGTELLLSCLLRSACWAGGNGVQCLPPGSGDCAHLHSQAWQGGAAANERQVSSRNSWRESAPQEGHTEPYECSRYWAGERGYSPSSQQIIKSAPSLRWGSREEKQRQRYKN